MHIVLELEKHLKSRDVSLYEFCKVADISYQQGLDLKNKKTKGINFSTLEKLCLYLNCQIDDLLKFKENNNGYIRYILSDFTENENVKRVPQTKPSDTAKPFLQWVGGKREMIKQYEEYFPKTFNKFYEPMLGGGAIFFYLKPSKSIINDNNPELIASYEAIRDNPEEVIEILHLLRRKHCKELYMTMRSLDRKMDIYKQLDKTEIAARMIYLNQTCFNGVYRVNKSGQFNVPIGSSLNRVICDPVAILKASEALKSTEIVNKDFEQMLDAAQAGDFVYFDPPYFPISEYSDFTRYTKEKFYKHDQERLANMFRALDKKGVKVMLSNSDAEFINDLYSDFNIHKVLSARTLNSKSDKRGKVTEVLVTNY